ncbi:YheC/YheD family protein [Brevibacillus sp. SYP-B805]|uniref:YheC/YheD family endospore coat-associated protein n=1 Tax=Brevibacillus sp. SYP-B805 TaxID=1578199 RepID=UPI0013E9C3E2|nr:YheC/YheD family protein [Brevibacillus sp. SYP-B805]NGQ94882.1 YheC/YheD family protein [Brevibacillus sp. SYP-B805]
MPQSRTGWLTILPADKWYLQAGRLPLIAGKGRRIVAHVGPFAQKKHLYVGLPPLQQGRIRTRVRWKIANDRLAIGPLIGILTVGYGMGFRGNRENFRDIFLSGKKLGALVYVFTPGGIDWTRQKIRGFLYDDKQDAWLEATLPFPHVVYNRIPSRKWETQSEVRKTLDQLASIPNITLFNRRFFNKQTLFHLLDGNPEAAPFLPDTKRLDSYARLRFFTLKHPVLYLKPVLGKAGEGIMRLDQHNERWRLRRVHEQRSITRYFSSLEEVWDFVKKRIRNKPYLIQQGIRLAHYKGRPFDIRVLVQKNGSGVWGVTGIGIRHAGANSITTHVPRGGSIQSPQKVLGQLFPKQEAHIMETVKQTALTIARCLDKELDSLAEMSMDLGLTKDGRLWFFEANAKPEKFDEPTIRRASLSNLIRYAQYVSRMKENKEAAAG